MNSLIEKFRTAFFDFLFPQKLPTNLSKEEIFKELKKPDDWSNNNIIVLFDYGEKLSKKLVWELKYKNNLQSAKILAEAMHDQIINHLNDWIMFENFENPILIPVPLSKEKLKSRGYNQTEILTREIMTLDGGKNLCCEINVALKTKNTSDQSSLKKTERLRNLKGCFKITKPEKIKDRNIIIIDDVLTTGATIKEMKKTLEKAGARKVKAVVVAH